MGVTGQAGKVSEKRQNCDALVFNSDAQNKAGLLYCYGFFVLFIQSFGTSDKWRKGGTSKKNLYDHISWNKPALSNVHPTSYQTCLPAWVIVPIEDHCWKVKCGLAVSDFNHLQYCGIRTLLLFLLYDWMNSSPCRSLNLPYPEPPCTGFGCNWKIKKISKIFWATNTSVQIPHLVSS